MYSPMRGHAQPVGKAAALQEVQRMRDAFRTAKGLAMDMAYYYANESSPAKYLDSLKGHMLLNGKEYRLLLDQTEAMVNERYSIVLFGEDRIMYLSKPSKQLDAYNPVAALDSLVTGAAGTVFGLQNEGAYRTVTIAFTAGRPYQKMSFTIDTATGYLVRSVMLVKTELMAPSADPSSLKKEGYDAYSVVETRLTGYRKEAVPESYFNEASFFEKKGKEFRVTERYKDYKIFLGSPDL